MTIDEKIAVMQAFKEGKEIESMNIHGAQWYETTTPSWDFSSFYYREKPEPEPPKYEPFSFEDDLVGKVILCSKMRYLILSQTESAVYIPFLDYIDYENLLKNYTFTDGSPCGKLVQP